MIGAPQRRPSQHENEALLRSIGVTEEVLLAALAAGDVAASRCTANHPPMAPGFYRFSETVAALAEQLAPDGWIREDHKNFSTVVRSDRRVAIAVASGNDGTGDLSAEVTTRSPKGNATFEAVETNLLLPYDERYVAQNKRPFKKDQLDDEKTITYFLLHDRRDGILYAELSRPKLIDPSGYVQEWEPRIPLKTTRIDPIKIDFGGGEPPLNPDVDVSRR